MPSYTRGKARDKIVWVRIVPEAPVLYGFNVKDFSSIQGISAADIALLGHLQVPTANTIRFLRANSPKPARVKKTATRNPSVTQQGSASTFCAGGSLTGALAGGWKLIKSARSTSLRQTGRSVTAIAKLSDESLYCFPMNKADFDTYGSALGLITASGLGSISAIERWSLVSGSSQPKPGRAAIATNNGTFESFYSTEQFSELTNAGWNVKSSEAVIP